MARRPAAAADLAAATWPEIPSGALVLVPVGSTEQHGPHLPFDTDSVIARAVAERTAVALSGPLASRVLVAPTVAYGASGEHADFPGTVSIGHGALALVLVEMVRSLSLWARRVVFINGHGGNHRGITAAIAQLRAESHDVAWTDCTFPGGDAHAGRAETSVMLHLAPENVRMEAASVGETRPLAALMLALVTRGVRAVSPSGVLGDPTDANPPRGNGRCGRW